MFGGLDVENIVILVKQLGIVETEWNLARKYNNVYSLRTRFMNNLNVKGLLG